MATEYQVTITMQADTVTALSANSFTLYGFQVVRASAGGTPAIWFQGSDFALTTTIAWQSKFQAYLSHTRIAASNVVNPTASYPMELGQVLTVSNAAGSGQVSQAGAAQGGAQSITILNTTDTQFTCGIEQQQPDGGFSPVCAFPLFGNNMRVIVPVEQICLMFSPVPLISGSLAELAHGPGILIDLTDSPARSVSYDINSGWTWAAGADWAQKIEPNQNLVPLLIQPVAALNAG